MGAPAPQVLLEPVASKAAAGNITNPMPETQPAQANGASVQLGFPPITMENELAGGEPPNGQDMNGLLFLITSHTLWVECGQAYQFNATLAAAIGGYAQGSILGMADGSGLWLCTQANNQNDPDTGGAGWVPLYSYGHTTVAGLTGGVVTLTSAQTEKAVIVLQGALASNLTINLPQTEQQWLIINQTTGNFTTTVKTAANGSQGVQVPAGGFSAPLGVYSVGDGNIYPTVAPLSVPISQNADPLTLAERTSAGYLLATYLNQSSGIENPAIGAVFVQNSSADGYLRKAALTYFEAALALQNIGGTLQPSQIAQAAVTQFTSVILANAALTGTPTAPTAASGASNTQVATTAFANPNVTVNANGVAIQLPSGYIIQFGTKATGWATVPVDVGVTFPRQFPTGVLAAGASTIRSVASYGQAIDGSGYTYGWTQNGMTITIDAPSGSWWAFGH